MKYLTNTDDINQVLKDAKKADFVIIYTSPWCDWCKRILDMALEATNLPPVYVINSWDNPEAWGTYKIMSAPAVLVSGKNSLKIITEYSSVYKFFQGSTEVESQSEPSNYRNPVWNATVSSG